ncbi:MAG: nodulation protein NfeD [Oligoflexia bacterium]|nr:nodulation protein NfeD [Oligoflexia bacterium]
MKARLLLIVSQLLLIVGVLCAQNLDLVPSSRDGYVAVLDMNMMILPGTASYLEKGLTRAADEGAKVAIVRLNTPGGLLESSQQMIQSIFRSRIPVVIYVGPSGSTAASAGVFITMAGHVAAMAPSTTIGAAHPVSGDGQNLQSDMRAKAENLTAAMVKSISEQRGRNAEWAEKAVKESSSLTEKEALKLGVIDFIANDLDELLKKIAGRKVKLDRGEVAIADYSALPRKAIEIDARDKGFNILANPNVMALLWLAATTGLSIELYNPGAILPGVVGLISLILALTVGQVIPTNQGAIALFVAGALLIGAELWVPSGILGVGGIIAMVLGSVYLFDPATAPGMGVDLALIVPVALVLGGLMLAVVIGAAKVMRRKAITGAEGLAGLEGQVTETVSTRGKVFVNGEIWSATSSSGILEKGAQIRVVAVREGLLLEVERI